MDEQRATRPALYVRDAGHDANEYGSDIRRHLGVVRARLWTILACAIVVFTLVAVYTFRATPVYEANAILEIERVLPQVSPFGGIEERRDEGYYLTQVNLITSHAVLEKALKNEQISSFFSDKPPLDTSQPNLVQAALGRLKSLLSTDSSRPKERWEQLGDMVEAKPVPETNLVTIKASGSNAEIDAAVANAIAEAYVGYSVAMRQKTALDVFQMLQDQKKEQEKSLKEAEIALQSYTSKDAVTELSESDNEKPMLDRLKSLNAEFTNVQLRRIELGVIAGTTRQALKDPVNAEALLALKDVRTDTGIQAIYDKLMETQLQLAVALSTYGDKHPQVIALKDQKTYLLNALKDTAAAVARSVQAEYDMLQARENELTRALEKENVLALQMARSTHDFDRLKRERDRQARVFDVIVDRMKEVDLTKDVGLTNVSWREKAAVPREAVRPNKQRSLLLGAFMGLLLGFALAYFLEYLDDTVKSPDDVEKRLKLAPLGYVPEMPAGSSGKEAFIERATHSLLYPQSSVSEAFRHIRTNIYFSGQRGKVKSLLITSTAPGDGKTSFASNLAIAMAQDGRRVLLVDADLRRPRLHEAYGLDREPGLTNLLVEGTALESLVHEPVMGDEEHRGNLHVLCAGAKTPNPAELLGGEAMARFMKEARHKYDMVILDSCPVMLVADAPLLASGCDGCVLVLKAARTRFDPVERAGKQLVAVNGKVIGAVLNGVRPKTMRTYRYGYSYYYESGDYGYAYQDADEKA